MCRSHARRLLGSGLAGEPVRLPSATLYDAVRVDDLATRRVLEEAEVDATCPQGLFIGRGLLEPGVPPARRLREVSERWNLQAYERVWLRLRIDEHGFLPFVHTVSGFVALGADVVDLRTAEPGRRVLELREPGAWFDALRHRRLVTGPGPPHLVRGWHPTAGGGRSWGVGHWSP